MARQRYVAGLGLLVLVVGLMIGRPVLAEAVCAQVKIEIRQELTLERQAFDAMMRIDNGLDTLAIENVDISVSFEDEDGNSVLASSDPNSADAKFFIDVDSMENIADVSGDGVVHPGSTAEIHWLIIPAPGAAENLPAGKLFFVGARLSYTLGGVVETVDVTPDFITVKPLPSLTLDYFLTRDVVGDDAFTTEIEPSEPYTLGVRVKNDGIVAANNLKIDSAQPQIIENEQGLAIGFQIIGSSIDDQPVQPQLLLDFGEIGGSAARVGRWQMTSSLSGEFVDFDATFTHADELGGQLTSLIDAVNTHSLIRDVQVDLPGRDAIDDFLARDGDIYRVYESQGQDSDVADASAQASLSVLDTQPTYTDYRLIMPAAVGFSYVQLPDPHDGAYQVISTTRADGKVMSTDNVWTSRTRNRNTSPPSWNYHLNLFDADSNGAYTVRLGPVVVGPEPPVIAFLPDRSTAENGPVGFLVEASDPNGDAITLATAALPAGATFVDNGDGTGFFNWTPSSGQAGSYIIRFTANDGVLEGARLMTVTVNGNGDSDGDGMDDDWELLWFETLARDGTGDYDGDGISDLSEFINDSDPARAPGPGQPEPLTPLYAAEVEQLTPTLAVQNGQHGLAQVVDYYFELYRDANLDTLIASSGSVAEDAAGETAWTVPVTLDDNATYHWRVRAHDGATYSEWARSRFVVDSTNDAPGTPQISWPADGSQVATSMPTLSVTNASDPEQHSLTYHFAVFEDAALTILVDSAEVPAGLRGVTAWPLSVNLVEGGTYYWQVAVTDPDGLGAQSQVAQFSVDTFDAPPPAPPLVSPLDNAELASTLVDLSVGSVTDTEGASVIYRFELDTENTFDSPNRQSSDPLSATGDTVTWRLPELADDTHYYWRVQASDGAGDSAWVNGQFAVNTTNDAPPLPLPGNLDAAGWSETLTPTLYLIPGDESDGDSQRYEFELYAYSRANGVGGLLASTQSEEPVWSLPVVTSDYAWLAWRARSIDEHDAASDWTVPAPIFVDNVAVPETLIVDAPNTLSVSEGSMQTIDLSAYGVGAPVCWLAASDLPPFVSLTDLGDGQAQLLLSPNYGAAGTYTLELVAGHQGTLCDGDRRMLPFAPHSLSVTLTVDDQNRAPLVANPGVQTVAEGSEVSIAVTASDPDNDALSYSAIGLPAGVVIDGASGVISGPLSYDSAGTYVVNVTVVDDGTPSLNAQTSFDLEVTDVNRAPVLVDVGTLTATEGQPFSLSLQATDPDGDTLSFGAAGLPQGLVLDATTGEISGIPDVGTAGSHTVAITVEDNGTPPLRDGDYFALVVVSGTPSEVPAVAWLNPADGTVYTLGAEVVLEATASDADGSVSQVNFTANGEPLGSVTAAPYTLNWMPAGPGSYVLAVEAVDDDGNTASATRTVEVAPVHAGQAVAAAYYVLNPRLSLGDASVVSLEDSNVIRVGSTELMLNRYERGTLPAAELLPGAVITGTGAFDIGSDVNGTDVPASHRLAGTQFVMPQVRDAHRYYLLSPYGDAQASVQLGDQSVVIDLPRGEVVTHDAGSSNNTSVRIRADMPIVAAHAGMRNGVADRDVMPLPPAAVELTGRRSRGAYIGALEDNTLVSIYAANGEQLEDVSLQAGERYVVKIGDDLNQGRGDGLWLVANKPIGAVQSADGDGSEQTAFIPTPLHGTRFALPVDAEYVAMSCTRAATVVLYQPDWEPRVTQCTAYGDFRWQSYFDDVYGGAGYIPAGSYIESDQPIQVIYETDARNDEHNLIGHNPVKEAYYVLNPRLAQQDAHVVSLQDNNLIQVGDTQLSLNRYERGVLPAAELAQGAVISGSGAFDIGSTVDGTDVPVSYRLAGTQFVVPQERNGQRYRLLSPYGDAQVDIEIGGRVDTLTLPEGEVVTYAADEDNGVAALIHADRPILVVHAGLDGRKAKRDVFPVPPAATELWGLRSKRALIGALEDGTEVDIYADDGSLLEAVGLSAGEYHTVTIGSDSVQGMGSAFHVVANKPIGAVQSADGDGNEQTAFFPTGQLGLRFGLPVDTQYVVVTCTQPGTDVTLTEPGQAPQTQVCAANGAHPGHVYFGSMSKGVHVVAGAYLESEAPVHVIYEPAASNDEHNLMGTVPVLPESGSD